ncbi:MAG: xanthine dehydrogenase family protein molybdopterin-binding subunit, partial [Stellaceae bacterium]
VEDERLLKGEAKFVADIKMPGTLEAVFVRSVHAHAAIVRIDAGAARAVPGVAIVLTARETAGRTAPLSVAGEAHTPQRLLDLLKPLDRVHPSPLLPGKTVTYVGQPVAMIAAETLEAAIEAAERLEIEYDPLAAVIDPVAALAEGAPLVEPQWNSNLALSVGITKGDPEKTFADAPVVVEDEFVSHRYVASPLEGRGIQASLDPVTGTLAVWASTQTAHVLQSLMAASLKLPVERIRVIACDVGGGFGQKGVQSVEDMLVAFAAIELGRTVRWIEQRSENLIAAPHAREQIHRIAVAATEDGRILGLRDEAIMNCGAYNFIGLVVPYNSLSHLLGPYDIAHVSILVKGVLTNTTYTSPYRGAGRPEAVFAIERIIDRLAARLGREAAEVRALNLVAKQAMPYDTGILYRDGLPQVYDSGDFPELLKRARELIGLDRFRAAGRAAASDGKLRGIGFSMYVEGTGMGPFEGAQLRVLASGRVQVSTGACSAGQGHRTVYAQIAADALGVPLDAVDVIGGDTATVPFGIGSIASRSTVTAGNAIHQTALHLKERILTLAGEMLEAAPADLELVDGKVRLKGVPGRALTLAAVAREAATAALRRGARGDGLLAETAYFSPPTVTYASAANAAIVALDPETGSIAVERYVVVHDCGPVVNPLLAEAQIAGGVMQGIGGAIREAMLHDAQGQPLTGSFMDYAMPIAADAPPLVLDHIETRSPRNPLGVKGIGEGGAIGPPAAIANAVEDALRSSGAIVRRGPLSPSRTWELMAGKRE